MLKAGFPAWGVTGDPNATVDRAEPLVFGPQFGGHGATAADLSVAFVSECVRRRRPRDPPSDAARPRMSPVGLASMVRNATIGETQVDADGARVTFDDRELTADPVDSVSLSRLYFL